MQWRMYADARACLQGGRGRRQARGQVARIARLSRQLARLLSYLGAQLLCLGTQPFCLLHLHNVPI